MRSLILITLAGGAAAQTTPLTCPTAEIPPASVHKLIVAARFRSTAWRCGSLAARFSGFCAQEVPPRIMPVIYDVVFPRQRGQRVRRQSRLPPDLLRPLRPVPVLLCSKILSLHKVKKQVYHSPPSPRTPLINLSVRAYTPNGASEALSASVKKSESGKDFQ